MIYVIIPNFNGFEHLETCLSSVFRQTYGNFRVIMVDNGSVDESVKYTSENYPQVTIIKNNYNTGFAAAVNSGIKTALKDNECKYILLLNNDVECDKYFLEEIQKGFSGDNVGSVASKMMNYFKRETIDDTGNFIKLIGSPYGRGSFEKDTGQYDTPGYVFGACAGAAIYRREVFERTGLFDEDFFAYYEDVDFSFKMQLAGYKCYYIPKAICYHKRGATTGYISAYQTMLCEKNLIALRVKNYPLVLLILLSPLFIAGRIVRFLSLLLTGKFGIFFGALKGYLLGVLYIPKSFIKRRGIVRKTGYRYIYSLFTK